MGAKRSVRPAPDYNWNYSKASAPPTGGTLTFLFSNNLCIFFILSELCRFSCDVWYKVTKIEQITTHFPVQCGRITLRYGKLMIGVYV